MVECRYSEQVWYTVTFVLCVSECVGTEYFWNNNKKKINSLGAFIHKKGEKMCQHSETES